MIPIVTVGVVLYGDHPDLAERCLGPLWDLRRSGLIQLRIGCNSCSDRTMEYLGGALHETVPVVVENVNIHKYPMMRALLNTKPLQQRFMWFDDDSYISGDPEKVVRRAVDLCADRSVVGQVWQMPLGGNQHLWVKAQPWYTGKPVPPQHNVRFCQGGWWVAPSELLHRLNWPSPELVRKGGDVMFGELCRQQGIFIHDVGRDFGVRINADKEGRHSRSVTRGDPEELARTRHPIGWNYDPAAAQAAPSQK
jgi:hypothetical protein